MNSAVEDAEPRDPLEDLAAVWADEERTPFDLWLRRTSGAFLATSLELEAAARLIQTTSAELDAALRLATLDDDSLAILAAGPRPPRTTWYAFAGASPAGVRAGAEALGRLKEGEPATLVVDDAISAVEGPSKLERVGGLDGKVFGHLAHKAKQYDVLSPKSRQFLVDIAIRRNVGKTLTEGQAAYALNLLTDLVDRGIVRQDSADGDQPICDEVLAALGRSEG